MTTTEDTDRTITFPTRIQKRQAEGALAAAQVQSTRFRTLSDALGLNKPAARGWIAEFIDLTDDLFVVRVAGGPFKDDAPWTVVHGGKAIREFFPTLDSALLAAVALRHGITDNTLVYAALAG